MKAGEGEERKEEERRRTDRQTDREETMSSMEEVWMNDEGNHEGKSNDMKLQG